MPGNIHPGSGTVEKDNRIELFDMTGTTNSPVGGLDWLLEDLVGRLAGAEHAVALSADGLLLARSSRLARADAEQLAAMGSALRSLARSVGSHFRKGEVHQTVVELDRGYLVVTEAGEGACLALFAAIDSDLGMVAYEMNVVVAQVGTYLATNPRGHLGVTSLSHTP